MILWSVQRGYAASLIEVYLPDPLAKQDLQPPSWKDVHLKTNAYQIIHFFNPTKGFSNTMINPMNLTPTPQLKSS